MDPVLFEIGNFEIRWYSVIMLISIIIAFILIKKEGRRFGIDSDFLFNMGFWTVIFGIIGARLYYVIFNYELYKGHFWSIFKIWEGGIAIHGAIIGGFLTILFFCKKNHTRLLKITDICVPGLIIAQAIGRWGNFFNGEAHGPATTLVHLQNMHIPKFIIDGMNIAGIYYEPTFLYESLFCFLGFLILIIVRRYRYLKTGVLTSLYLMYYSVVRFLIESLRTDSLMLGGFKVAQIVSIILFIVGLGYILYSLRKSRFEDLYNDNQDFVVKY